MKNYKIFLLLFITFLQFIIGTTIFIYQGGFGGGHGIDYLFYLFQLPGVLALELVSDFFWINDFIAVVVIPFVLNFIIYFILIAIYRFIKKLIND